MRIWFDADNGPHVLIMRPLIEHLAAQGHDLLVTARDRTRTCELLDLYGIPYHRVGGEYRPGRLGKVAGTLGRATALARAVRGWGADVSFGHGSRALPLASRLLGVPSVTMYDYEWVNPTLFNRFCRSILLPRVIGRERCREAGIRIERVRFYDGLKEELYLSQRMPAPPDALADLGLRSDRLKVLLRPPATTAHYHNPEAEVLLASVLEHLAGRPDLQLVYMPRTPDQRELIPAGFRGEVIVPQRVYDGPTLIAAMDAVFSGGGTMTREAAVLGVPAYSFFRGRQGRVDEWLQEQGRLVLLDDPAAVSRRVQLVRREDAAAPYPLNTSLVEQVAGLILAAA